MIQLKVLVNGQHIEREYPDNTTYKEIAEEFQPRFDQKIALVEADGKLRELFKRADGKKEISFIFYNDLTGHRTYVRTAMMIFLKALDDVLGNEIASTVRVKYKIGPAYYCAKENNFELTAELIDKIDARMKEIIAADVKLMKAPYPVDKAMEFFDEQGMNDKQELFRFRRSSFINIYDLDGYKDYYYGYMLPSAGYIDLYKLTSYEDGFLLILPTREDPKTLPEFKPLPKLLGTLKASDEWARAFGISTVGDLNARICNGHESDLILVEEASQERRIAEIAREVNERAGVKFVMIAGPSSSGKTSFANRLSIQLRTLGKIPHLISVDDYFVNRDQTPKDANGDYDFECLEAIDVKQFNQDMTDLLQGKTIKMPTYNFKSGKREYLGNTMTLGAEDILVIEGIHCLNDKMSELLPKESKFKIYISALTTLNIDEHNRIPTTDGRLLRRIVRDARTRGNSAQRTIQMWPSVRNGEEKNIFPYQESADAMFNSSLIYELAIIKTYAEPLLFNISKEEPEYIEAKRLLKFLSYFLAISNDSIPNNSLCREFVGGSCFRV
ncbi:MAG: nucleoside kinase [Lachnospiraceae bacterium]|nr:nucleoside kinase [Lachnospiraceae bacterium]